MHDVITASRDEIGLEEFPNLYQEFFGDDSNGAGNLTLELESKGGKLRPTCSDETIIRFMKRVFIEWGGRTGHRVVGMAYKFQSKRMVAKSRQNSKELAVTEEKIAEKIRESMKLLRGKDLEAAIAKITSLKGLGISYGSKLLRMLSPEQAGVYDSIINKYLSYSLTAADYVRFCADCQKIADELNATSIQHPYPKSRKGGMWYVADVEAVVFHHFYH